MWCHVLFFGFPLLGLPLFWLLPLPVALGIYVLLSALSVGAGIATLRAMRTPPRTGPRALVGRLARIVSVEGTRVLVRVGGELWNAAAEETLVPGQPVVIVSVDGLTVTVRPVNDDSPAG